MAYPNPLTSIPWSSLYQVMLVVEALFSLLR
jgi:hypothetical protein